MGLHGAVVPSTYEKLEMGGVFKLPRRGVFDQLPRFPKLDVVFVEDDFE